MIGLRYLSFRKVKGLISLVVAGAATTALAYLVFGARERGAGAEDRTMQQQYATLSTDELFALARTHKMTPQERRAQRVSMIMGLRGGDSTLTHEKVEEVLDEVEGREDD